MQSALDVTVPYVHERKQFGVHIGEFQVILKIIHRYIKAKFFLNS